MPNEELQNKIDQITDETERDAREIYEELKKKLAEAEQQLQSELSKGNK